MADIRVQRLAKVVVDYSLGVRKGETIYISASPTAAPLVEEVYRLVLRKGAYPWVRIRLDGLERALYEEGSAKQIEHLGDIAMYEAQKVDRSVRIIAGANVKELASIDPTLQGRRRKALKPLMDAILAKPWNLVLFPTQAYAQAAEMSLGEFEDFVYGACFCDKRSPVAEWRKLSRWQAGFVERLNGAGTLRIVGRDTDISMSIKGRTFINSDGHFNMPSGELFSGPVEDSAEGSISFEFPAICYGHEVEGVRLKFKRGVVVEASAEKGDDFLQAMLEMDEGSRRLGEVAIGTNYGITSFVKNILFDEKIGGTVHLALGNGYPETGSVNVSALHWDMIKDLRHEGKVYVDGKVFMSKGKLATR